jgi:hypothetical protein
MSRGLRWACVCAAWVVVPAGCSEELAPLEYESRTVSGQVAFQGKPVSNGWVEFVPMGGTVGNIRTARIASNGRYAARGVAVGRHRVKIVGADPPLPDAYSTDDTTLRCEVRAQGENALDLVLE